jgi:hypothetical protein
VTFDPRERIDVVGTVAHLASRGVHALDIHPDAAGLILTLSALIVPALVGSFDSREPRSEPRSVSRRASNDPPPPHDVSGSDVAGGAIAAAAFGAAMGVSRGASRVHPAALLGAGFALGYAVARFTRPRPLARKESKDPEE